MAQLASSNRTKLSIAEETVPGVKQPLFYDTAQIMRITSESLAGTLSYISSEELRADRQKTDLILTDSEVGGGIEIEFSAQTYDNLLESVMGSTFTTPAPSAAESGVTVDSTSTFAAAAFTIAPALGQWFRVTGRTDTLNNGFFQASKTVAATSTSVAVEGTPLTIDAVSESTTFQESAQLKLGVSEKSFTIVRTHEDTAPVTYFTYVGLRVASMDFNFATGSILSSSVTFMGETSELSEVAPTGTLGNETAATTTDILNAVSNLQNVFIDGDISSSFFTDLSISVDGSLRGAKAIGRVGNVDVLQGSFNITGSLTSYYEDKSLYDKYLNATAFSVAIAVEDGAGVDAYVFYMPKVKYSDATINAGGSDQDIMVQGSYEALKDAIINSSLVIEKFVA